MSRLTSILASAILAFTGLAEAETVTLAIGEWAPFTGEHLPGYGAANEIASEALRAAGLQTRFLFFPWKRVEAEVLYGAAFATLPFLKIPEREIPFYFSDVLFSSDFAIVYASRNSALGDFRYARPENLKGYRIGITVGSEAVRIPLSLAGAEVLEMPDPEFILKMLDAGRIDFAVENRMVMRYYADNYFPEGMFTFLETPFGGRSDYRMMVSKAYPGAEELLERFNASLAFMRESGEVSAILDRHGLR